MCGLHASHYWNQDKAFPSNGAITACSFSPSRIPHIWKNLSKLFSQLSVSVSPLSIINRNFQLSPLFVVAVICSFLFMSDAPGWAFSFMVFFVKSILHLTTSCFPPWSLSVRSVIQLLTFFFTSFTFGSQHLKDFLHWIMASLCPTLAQDWSEKYHRTRMVLCYQNDKNRLVLRNNYTTLESGCSRARPLLLS